MKYTVSCKNTNNSEAINEKLSDVLERLDKYFPKSKSPCAKIRLETKDRKTNKAKVEISICSGKACFRAESSAENHYTAIDECFDKLNKQMRRYKDKKISSKRMNNERIYETVDEEEMEEIILNYEPQITKTKRFKLTPMSIDSAIKEMDSLGHSFFIFLEKDTNTVSVVYNRDDNTYGIIKTQYNL